MFHNTTLNASFLPNFTTMEGLPKEDNFPDFQRGLELFNDNELPPSLRSSCLALVAEQEIRSNPPTSAALPSPNKKRLLEQVSHINGLHTISTSQKQSTAGQLTQAYFESKHKFESSFAVPNSKFEPTTTISKPKPSIVEPTRHTMLCVPGSTLYSGNPHHPAPLCRITPKVWMNLPHVEYERLGDAMSALGPTIVQVKKSNENGTFITEYKCKLPNCKHRMRVESPGDGPFSGPVLLTTILSCSHEVITWEEHYRTLAAKRNDGIFKVISPKIGLHPLVRAYTDILSMTKLEPKEISRKLQADFAMDPMFIQSRPVRDIITQQIRSRVRLNRSEQVQNDPTQKNTSIQYTHDVVTFKEKHLLRLPKDFQPQIIDSETHLLELARTLQKTGHLCGKKHEVQTDFPHRDLIVLEYDDVEDSTRYKHLDARREKEKASSNRNTREAVKANTVVFTSLALLSNLCSSANLDWNVCGSADGTHGLLSNDYKVIGFGVYHIGTDGIKRFHPLAYALATGELELVSILLLHYIKCVARDLFGLIPQFKGGLISDHTEVFVNAFQEVFPGAQVLQCFPHIIRKFRIDGKREGNGQYMKLLENHQTAWLWDSAEEDVYMLRGCRSLLMFEKLKDMILSSWRDEGEQCLADTFRNSYLDNVLFNKWRYNVSGIPGCIPQNNSHERSNLDTKGCASFSGIIKSGRNMTSMMNNEFPRLIYINSIERTEVERNFPILDETKTMKPLLFEFFLEFDKQVDCFPYKEGYLVNRKYSLGEPINCDRVKRYEDSLAGKFELESSERHVFYSRVNELCFVTKQQLDPKKEPFYTGSCFHFYNHLSCHHAAVLQYAHILPTMAKKISQEKQGRRKRRKTGLQRVNKYHLRKMAEEHARLSSVDIGVPPISTIIGHHGICYPVSQTDNSVGLV
jgi:hypothetical protein